MTATADPWRVRWLVRCYPPAWRARYGAEFAEVLCADIAERQGDWRRTANVVRSGLLARCTQAGLTSHQLPAAEQIRAGLATLGCALTALCAFGLFILAQLATGWQVATAGSVAAAAGTLAMAVAAAVLALLAVAATVPVGWQAVRAIARREAGIIWPAVLALGFAAVLICGTRHFENFWPGTSGTGTEHAVVPGGLAAFGWASTLSVSAYWAHPGLWGIFPASEMAWMALSPVVWIGLVASVLTVTRRLPLTGGLQRYLSRVALAATVAAVGLLTGAATWVLARGPGQAEEFRPGTVDVMSLVIMAAASVVALRALGGIRRARLAARGSDGGMSARTAD